MPAPKQNGLVHSMLLHTAASALISAAPTMARQVTMVQRNYTIVVDDDLVVRRVHPPLMYDNKGKPRKPSVAELKEMKGSDPRLKGYKAERGDLQPGQIVVVTLAKASASNTKAASGAKARGSDLTKPRRPAYTVVGEYTGKLVRAPVPAANVGDGKENQREKGTIVVGLAGLRMRGQPAPAPRDKTRLPPSLFVVRIMIVAEAPSR